MTFKVRISFIAPYLQARFSELAKEELLKDARKTITRNTTEEDEQWIRFSYFDEKGYYVPSEQIKMSLVYSGKDFKMKARKNSLKDWIKATCFIQEERCYLNKLEPDSLLTSYPKRKDGNRVKVIHPSFNAGNEIEFTIEVLEKNFDKKTLKELVENAGKRYALGARRPEFGRFNVLEFKEL